MKAWIIGVVIVVLIIAGYFGYSYLNTGPVTVYAQDAPGLQVTLTITSIMLHKVNGSWVTVSNKTIIYTLSSNLTELISSRLPAGKYNEIFLYVKNASISVLGTPISIPSNVIKIHFVADKDLVIGPTENAQVIISFPHISTSSGSLIISPSITAEAIN
ncbi:DUF4382 domain-containing protein [Metallosphaera hakonensis]|uniref:DUF4382 domain-containing protein n=1 Tax=Metallosphaera hakonensis JCM 8857 = DSM 7519 TaxID=1293036 RepID=A0A2U9IXF5_9CREN|nr:DUF4382 domain-containing protein [Metallosphaera hakonensis]AWS00538.1 DUF4382 domain-containing protein [Metallosphaera hakonensis JCM 8857 = DSM 7519]